VGEGPLGYTCELPSWVTDVIDFDAPYPTPSDKMALVNRLARRNVEERTGGPFGAAVFDVSTDRLVGPGVNLVIPASNPTAHAEIVALGVAGGRLGTYDLGDQGRQPTLLATSVEPCAMCLGSIPWSGVSMMIVGARDEDARAVGFDEGDKPAGWKQSLRSRGIEVVQDVLRNEAAAILVMYQQSGMQIYNAAQDESRDDI